MRELLGRVLEVLHEAHLKREDKQDVDRRLEVINELQFCIHKYDAHAIGEIVMMGNDGLLGAPYLYPRFYSGIMPSVGTKLYISPDNCGDEI